MDQDQSPPAIFKSDKRNSDDSLSPSKLRRGITFGDEKLSNIAMQMNIKEKFAQAIKSNYKKSSK